MTTHQVAKIRQAIAECERFIAKEGARSADLRPVAVQELLAWTIAHRAKLERMLDAAPRRELPPFLASS